MKKTLILLAAAAMVLSCNAKNAENSAIDPEIQECIETYAQHPSDEEGVGAFRTLLTNYWSAEEALEEFEKASEIIKTNDLIITKVESIKHAGDVEPGKPYIEISGPNAITGETLSIGDVLAQGKPVLVDFWASWCPPCRREIKENLVKLYAEGEVNIIGIAVWENSVEDTRKAMEELGVTWPVIYTGGRTNSPSIKYGVLGIPTLFLVSPDGTIQASAHSIDDIEYFQK